MSRVEVSERACERYLELFHEVVNHVGIWSAESNVLGNHKTIDVIPQAESINEPLGHTPSVSSIESHFNICLYK